MIENHKSRNVKSDFHCISVQNLGIGYVSTEFHYCHSCFSGKSLHSRGSNLIELCEKFIIHLTKVLIAVLEHHPFSYVDVIQPSLEFTVFYVFTPSGESVLFERFIIQCLNLIKGILMCAEYKPAKVIEGKPKRFNPFLSKQEHKVTKCACGKCSYTENHTVLPSNKQNRHFV